MVNTVPSARLVKASVPPMLSSMISFAMYKPMPVPLPSGLLVKYGSYSLSAMSPGMPQPLSRT